MSNNDKQSSRQSRASYMTEADKKAMGNFPRTHQNCKKYTGVSRPGKSASDRSRKV